MCDRCKKAGPPWSVDDKTVNPKEALDNVLALGWGIRGILCGNENFIEAQLLCEECAVEEGINL